MKAAAVRAKTATEEYASGHMSVSVCYAECEEFNRLTDGPDNILALVEALESEKRICATWRKTAETNSETLEKAQAAERRWHRVASRIHEQACESDVKIDELEAIRAAAEKLVRCKGRYHSEQNYRALASLFGVNTPDLPPLEHENVHYADAAEMEIEALRQRIAELELHKAALLKFIRESCYVFDGYDADISDAYIDAASSSLMPKIEAEPCHHCSDGSYSGLPGGACEHCMGTGLDNPAAELESRTVTVKLPKPKNSDQGWKIDPEFINKVQDAIGYDDTCECWEGTPSMELVEAVLLAAAGIKVEAE
ncbi:ead/Ea22-like family protein [Klebsiella quasipneumoniae]|nr:MULTISPECIES: ead/Ea22-like family protein [Klebsiella]MDK6849666.1 ead/Ea22-like family protein [Klebsiella quasipneumoniae]MDK7891303.1 ead/Ea22-like family protein [Klebsiella quasipneumoniae]MDK8571206.1 ead/Ea22-like family protein [Klebsiella quasipneumoniae]